jgi:hypothetical protein
MIIKLFGLGAALALFALAAGNSGQVGLAQADCTITVRPGQSIQAAIDQAADSAVICLGAGTFLENLEIKKSLTLRGAGKGQTFIKGKEDDKAAINIDNQIDIRVMIESVTVSKSAEGIGFGREGINVGGKAQALIKDVSILDLHGHGLRATGSAQVSVSQVVISNTEGVIVHDSAQLNFTDSQISGSTWNLFLLGSSQVSLINSEVLRSRTFDGILVTNSSQLKLINSKVVGNGGDFFGGHGLILQDSATVESQGSSFLDNRGCGIFVQSQTANVKGTAQEFRGNGADLCGYAPVAFRKALVPQTDKTQLAVPGDYRSLQEAVDAVAPGGTITIAEGVYETGFTLWKPVILRGAGRGETTLKAQPGRSLVGSILSQADGVTLEAFSVTGSLEEGLLVYSQATLNRIQFFKNGGGVFSGALTIAGSATVTLQNIQFFDNSSGLAVKESAQVAVTQSQFSESFFADVISFGSARVTVTNSHVSKNGDGLRVFDSANVRVTESRIFENGGNGIEVSESARVEVRTSSIFGNGTNPVCKNADASEILSCDGIFAQGRAELTLIDSVIKDNADWGIGALLKQCRYDKNDFTGKVEFQGNNTIEGNNKSGNQNGMGNPGNHPFKNLPDGQVCLP